LKLNIFKDQINWKIGDAGVIWAFNCDFKNNIFKQAYIRGEKCGRRCVETKGCTHFSWTRHNKGTCWLKSGSVKTSDAYYSNVDGIVCGIPDKNYNPNLTIDKSCNDVYNIKMLELHNKYRFSHNAAPLRLDIGLTSFAQKYSVYLATQVGNLVHSKRRKSQGENLAQSALPTSDCSRKLTNRKYNTKFKSNWFFL